MNRNTLTGLGIFFIGLCASTVVVGYAYPYVAQVVVAICSGLEIFFKILLFILKYWWIFLLLEVFIVMSNLGNNRKQKET